MPVNMTLAALLMSGAVQTGEPVTKATLGADMISQPKGGASETILAQMSSQAFKKKGGKRKHAPWQRRG